MRIVGFNEVSDLKKAKEVGFGQLKRRREFCQVSEGSFLVEVFDTNEALITPDTKSGI